MNEERTKKVVKGEALWFYNYKEPLRRFKKNSGYGYGYVGVLAQ